MYSVVKLSSYFCWFLILFIYIINIGYWQVLFITQEQLGKSQSATSTFKYRGSTAAVLVFLTLDSCGLPHAQLVNLFLSVISKSFLHLFGCLVLHCFLEARSSYSSVTETKEVQRLIMEVGSIRVRLLFCQFYYTYQTCKHCALQ